MGKIKGSLFIILLTAVGISMTAAQQLFKPVKPKHEYAGELHEHKGKVFTGGSVVYWNNTKDKLRTFGLCPELGYLFNDAYGVGIMLGYEHESEKSGSKPKHIVNTFKLSPFVRYYYTHKEPFNFYLDGGLGVNIARQKDGVFSKTEKGFEIGIRPGACVDLTEGLCLCLRMGFIGYRNSYFSGEEEGLGKNGFGFRFAPEELMIGLELEF